MNPRLIGVSAAIALTLVACGHSPFGTDISSTRAPAAAGQEVRSAAASRDGRSTIDEQIGRHVNYSPVPTQGEQTGVGTNYHPTQGEQTGVDTNYHPTQGEQTGVDTNYRPTQGEQTGLATNYLRQ